ncbi:MAG TPA: MFS transporter [Thermoplasmata archaeon]|nr:MFS transporter [Thermoplasmata archaeon]
MNNESKASSYRWIILVVSSLLIMFIFMTQIIWSLELGSPAVEEGDLQDAFGGIEYGSAILGISLVVLTQGIGNFFQGSLVHKLGFRKTFLLFMPLLIIPQFLIPFLPQLMNSLVLAWYACLTLRAIQGLGLVFAVLSPLVGCWFPLRERGLAQGLFMTAVALNTGVGALIVALLSEIGWGWEEKFLTLGVLLVIFSIGWLYLMKEPPMEERVKGAIKIRAESGEAKKKVYSLPSTWLVVWIISMNCWVIFGVVGNVAPYLADIGYAEPFQKSLALLSLSLAGVVATPLGGKLSDLLIGKKGLIGARTRSLIIGFSLATGLAILFPKIAPLGYSLALVSVFFVGFGGPWTSGTAWALPTDLDPRKAGKISGVALIVGQAVGALSIYLVARIASLPVEDPWGLAYLILGGVSVLGILPCILLKKAVV